MSKPWSVSTSDQVPDWTLGRWYRREYNTPEGRAKLVTITQAARRLGIKPTTFTMLKFRHPDTFPKMVVQSGTPQWYVWEEIARFAAGFGHGDPDLVAEVRTEHLQHKLAEWATTLVELQTEQRRGHSSAELEQQIQTAKLRVGRWRRQLRQHLDTTRKDAADA